MDTRSPELIEQDIRATREALRARTRALEDHFVDTCTDVTASMTDAVEAVQQSVKRTVQGISSSLSQAKNEASRLLDVRGQVRRHPWTAVALASAAGLLGALSLNGRKRHASATDSPCAEHNLGSLGSLLVEEGMKVVETGLRAFSLGVQHQVAETVTKFTNPPAECDPEVCCPTAGQPLSRG